MSKEGIKSITIGPRNIGGGHIPDTLPLVVEEHIKSLEAQNKAMREALESIASGTCDFKPPYRNAPVDALKKLAQQALKQAEGK